MNYNLSAERKTWADNRFHNLDALGIFLQIKNFKICSFQDLSYIILSITLCWYHLFQYPCINTFDYFGIDCSLLLTIWLHLLIYCVGYFIKCFSISSIISIFIILSLVRYFILVNLHTNTLFFYNYLSCLFKFFYFSFFGFSTIFLLHFFYISLHHMLELNVGYVYFSMIEGLWKSILARTFQIGLRSKKIDHSLLCGPPILVS